MSADPELKKAHLHIRMVLRSYPEKNFVDVEKARRGLPSAATGNANKSGKPRRTRCATSEKNA